MLIFLSLIELFLGGVFFLANRQSTGFMRLWRLLYPYGVKLWEIGGDKGRIGGRTIISLNTKGDFFTFTELVSDSRLLLRYSDWFSLAD